MSYINIKKTLLEQAASLDPNLDTTPGSNFVSLVATPVSLIFSGYEVEQQRILTNLSLSNPADYTDAELDAIAANFLIERQQGTYHTGSIRLFFKEPVSLSVLAGTIFSANGFDYVALQNLVYSRQQMEFNFSSDGLYQTPEVFVRSNFRSTGGQLSVGNILTNNSMSSRPFRISVEKDINGGQGTETNAAFYERLKDEVRTNSLASEKVLERKVKSVDNTIESVKVIGAGSIYMTRDLVTYNQLAPNEVESFALVHPGQANDPGTKQHVAYINNFFVEDTALSGAANIQ